MVLVRIVAPHFVAGIVTDGRIRCAVEYMLGWSDDQVRTYVARKGWRATKHEGPKR